MDATKSLEGFDWCRVFPPTLSGGDGGNVCVLGLASLDSFRKKDLYASFKDELCGRGYTVVAVGQRELLGLSGVNTAGSSPAGAVGVSNSGFERMVRRLGLTLRPRSLVAARRLQKVFVSLEPAFFLTQWYVPVILDAAKNSGAKTLLWCMDDPMIIDENWFFGDWFNYACGFDFVYTVSRGAIPKYREAGAAHVKWLPLYFDTRLGTPHRTSEEYGITFVGNYFSDREPACQRILYPLIRKFGGRVNLFGSNWSTSNGCGSATLHDAVGRDALPTIFSNSRINLNLHRESAYRYAPAPNFRTFEITGSGGFELMEYMEGVKELFDLGSELVAATHTQEAVELAEYYYDRSDERAKIAANGRRRVLAEHTITHRFNTILGDMGTL
jgi:hypothetical protein